MVASNNDTIAYANFSDNDVSQGDLPGICEVAGRLKSGCLRDGLYMQRRQLVADGLGVPEMVVG
jgi:hypothetical protein